MRLEGDLSDDPDSLEKIERELEDEDTRHPVGVPAKRKPGPKGIDWWRRFATARQQNKKFMIFFFFLAYFSVTHFQISSPQFQKSFPADKLTWGPAVSVCRVSSLS